MQDCKVEYHEEIGRIFRPVKLDAVLEPTWTAMIRRLREPVIWRFLESRCGRLGLTRTRMTTQCTRTTGDPLPPVEWMRDCRSGKESRRP
jgi:hypothetical protein